MIMFDASPRLILARHHVRAVAWRERVWTATSLRQVLDNFPNISQLCLWNNLFPFDPEQLGPGERSEITQHYPALKRVATSLSARLYLPQSAFRSPFWMTITHLQVNYYMNGFSSKLSPFELPLFTSISSLSHLALLDMDIFGEDDLDLAFSRVKQTFPPLLFMCLLALMPRFKRQDHWFADSKVISMSRKVDERIVMVSSPDEDNSDDIVVVQCKDNFPEWFAIQDGAQTLWEKGETVLKRRRERLAAV
ncbi:hypothetical protein DL96DRAFT_1623974 [Flagelloscypha sp. PMI_526]|nr:hypothetical protein DL96DRAFT_1623974 [Flagelloscypha sp. PMI_526]